jgi:hypothetical protein
MRKLSTGAGARKVQNGLITRAAHRHPSTQESRANLRRQSCLVSTDACALPACSLASTDACAHIPTKHPLSCVDGYEHMLSSNKASACSQVTVPPSPRNNRQYRGRAISTCGVFCRVSIAGSGECGGQRSPGGAGQAIGQRLFPATNDLLFCLTNRCCDRIPVHGAQVGISKSWRNSCEMRAFGGSILQVHNKFR